MPMRWRSMMPSAVEVVDHRREVVAQVVHVVVVHAALSP
jgi:hypothetical protein